MRILYGVQATGNGHITRARAMAEEFNKMDIQVDYLFSGRPSGNFFDMSPFGAFKSYPGLTFSVDWGKIKYLKTALHNKPLKALTDITGIPAENYELVITDFEPLTAWAAKIKRIPSLGISHQYSFRYKIPRGKSNPIADVILKYFAPAEEYIGVHWHHFDLPILPPISQPVIRKPHTKNNKILVYLPLLELSEITSSLKSFRSHHFCIYHDTKNPQDFGNLHIRSFSRKNFHEDLATCTGVICNTGFTLISEAIQHGKNILTIPLHGQIEQLANAEALKELNMAVVLKELDITMIGSWLESIKHTFVKPVDYPNVANLIVSWIADGMQESKEELAARIWNITHHDGNSNIKKNYYYAPLN